VCACAKGAEKGESWGRWCGALQLGHTRSAPVRLLVARVLALAHCQCAPDQGDADMSVMLAAVAANVSIVHDVAAVRSAPRACPRLSRTLPFHGRRGKDARSAAAA